MPNEQSERAQGGAYPADYEREGSPDEAGKPPRPPGEPKGSKGSSDGGGTWTDPATGEAHDRPDRDPSTAG